MSASEVMASEFEAAAERWGRGLYNVGDGKLLADWAVTRLAADRAEREERARPIDAEWLESIGCKKMAINRWKIQEQIRVNVWLVECVRWMVRIDGWLVQIHTRGQLLDLLRVLKGGAE